MKHLLFILFALFISYNCSDQKVEIINEGVILKNLEVDYTASGTTLNGYIAFDENKEGPRPGVIVVHEWWGNNDYSRRRADMLAGLGYTAFAIDMFGDGKHADNPKDAGKLAGEVMQDMNKAKERFDAAINILKQQPQTDSTKIAAIGYCFGGGVVLRMALMGSDLDGVVSFHGSLPTDPVQNKDSIKAKLLVLNGADDPFVPQEQVDSFKKAMDSADVDYEFINYDGAVHAFTNPAADSVGKKFEIPIAYNKEADDKSWAEMEKFLDEIF